MDTKKVTAEVQVDEARRVGWLRMAILGTATVAAAAVVAVVTLGRLPTSIGPTGTSSESPDASVASSATLAPSEASVPSSLDGQDYAFWTLYRPPPCCGSLLRIFSKLTRYERVSGAASSANSIVHPGTTPATISARSRIR